MEKNASLDHLRRVVERMIYQPDGCSILKCAAKGYSDLVAVVGMMPMRTSDKY